MGAAPGRCRTQHSARNARRRPVHDHASSHSHASHLPASPASGSPAHSRGSHDIHAGHSVAMFRRKFWIALLLTVPATIWGEMIPRVLGFAPPSFPGSRWIPLVFGSAVFVYGGWPFLVGAWHELLDRRPGMMTLISLAITVAFVYSLAVTFMLLGHWMEMRSIAQAQGALGELAKLLPNTATRIVHSGLTEDVNIDALREGDLVLVRPRSE